MNVYWKYKHSFQPKQSISHWLETEKGDKNWQNLSDPMKIMLLSFPIYDTCVTWKLMLQPMKAKNTVFVKEHIASDYLSILISQRNAWKYLSSINC